MVSINPIRGFFCDLGKGGNDKYENYQESKKSWHRVDYTCYSDCLLLRIMCLRPVRKQERKMDNADGSYLVGKLLLAMPAIGDPRFHRAVIYLCAHDKHGAMGLVINSPAPELKFEQLLEQLGIESDIKVDLKKRDMPVFNGGPVETARGFLLHTNEFKQDDTVQVDDTFSITGTTDALKAVANGKGPDKALFILGYAGWVPGQLETELQQNAWLVADPDPALIFENKSEEKWTHAMQGLGLDLALLSGEMGRA